MVHPLQQRVDAVTRRVSRLRWTYLASSFFLAAIGLIAAAVLADYLLRPHDPGVRWIVSLALVGALGWAFYRLVIPSLASKSSSIGVAQRIEQHFPALGKRLSSAIAFLGQSPDDVTAGSLDLRRAVVAETEALSVDLDYQGVVDARQPRRMLLMAGIAVVALAGLTAAAPWLVVLGLARLAMPWENTSWPARHALAFAAAPQILATGDEFNAEVIDRHGELPDEVELLIRRGGRTATHAMKRLGDRMIFRLDRVTEPFSYRAVGGDDYSMAWTTLEVVSPPQVTDLVVTVTPPPYTEQPAEVGRKLVRALAGSQLSLRGAVDKPIKSASLKTADGQTLPVRVAISADGKSFHAPADPQSPWLAEKSAEIWCEVSDESALPAGRQQRIELQVAADAPPTISWESPADHAFVTPKALVPIRALVKDDLAVARVELRYLRPDASDQGEHTLELFVAKRGEVTTEPAPQSLSLDSAWDLALIPGLTDGSILAVRIVAEDFKPQEATATIRRLTIISEAELENRVVQQQTSILTQLAEALRLQRETHDQTAELAIRLAERGTLAPQDLSHLQSAELNQRQVARLLSDPQDGVEARIAALLDELAHNRVASQVAADRMRELLAKVQALREQELAGISHELTAALKSAQARANRGAGVPPADPSSNCGAEEPEVVQQSLAAAGAGQERVITTLESLLGDLSQWDSFSRLSREVGQIRADQQTIAAAAEELRLEMAAGDVPAAADSRASSRALARRQLELARRYEKLQSRMDNMRQQLGQSDPLVAGTLADALDAARKLAIAGRMRSAAGELSDVRPGPAHQTQQAVLEGLAQLLDVLSRRRDAELARTAQSLAGAATDLDSLARRQQALRRELADAGKDPAEVARRRELERLSKEAQKLAEEVKELARKLERLQARRAAESGQQAAAAMDQSAQAAAADNADQADEQAATAQDLLEETKRQLQEQIKQAEQDLLREQLARLEQHVAGLIARQRNAIAETDRLAQLREQQSGSFTVPQEATLRGIAAEQRLLAEETQQLGTSLQAAAAFTFSIERISQRMLAAADQLDEQDTGVAVKAAQEGALQGLLLIQESLKSDDSGGEPMPMEDEQPQGAGGQPPAGAVQNIAELKLVKLMQEEIQRQTAELEKLRLQSGELTAGQVQQLDELARDQGKLAEMIVNMIEAAEEKTEDGLPDLPEPAEKGGAKGDNKGGKPRSLDEELLKELKGKR
ncbi:MAG TPA: hypothetical protein VMP01_16895 [Pirellulaceae bacterium]|nr:hypothetical protein [Pirellulaceae bacterium]